MKKIDIICANSDLGVHVNGSQLGPETLINCINNKDKINKVKKINYDKNYIKELDKNNNKKNLNKINIFNENLYNEVKNTLEENNFPITLGGSHDIAIGSALASISQYNNLGIIWFDAHGDFNTFDTTTSGNVHGLPFAAITNYEKKFLTQFHNKNFYNPKNSVLLGGRDIDKPFEMQNLKNAGITVITTEDIKKYGIIEMAKKAFKIASNGTNGVHVSYDLDVIDPKIAPGVSIPAINGLNLEEAYKFVDIIIENKEIIKSIDLVELNPLKDINKITENIASEILNKIINNL